MLRIYSLLVLWAANAATVELSLVSTITNSTTLAYPVEARVYPEDPTTMFVTNRGGGVSTWDIRSLPTLRAYYEDAQHSSNGMEGQDRRGDLLVVTALGDVPHSALITLNATSLEPLGRAPLDTSGALHCKLYHSEPSTYAIITNGLTHNATARRRVTAVDVSDVRNPRQVASVEVWADRGCSEGVFIVGDVAFIGSYCTADVATIDLAPLPRSMSVLQTVQDGAYENMVSGSFGSSYNRTAERKNLLFSASYAAPGGLVVFDAQRMAHGAIVEVPSHCANRTSGLSATCSLRVTCSRAVASRAWPLQVGRSISHNASRANRVHLRADLGLAMLPLEKADDGEEHGGVALFDISVPEAPHLLVNVSIPTAARVYTLASARDYIFVFSATHQMYVFELVRAGAL